MGYFIVTGATKGIGKAIAEVLAQKKKDLVLIARSEDILQSMASDFSEKYQIKVHFLVIDLLQPDCLEKIESFIVSQALEIEGLVNNAGLGKWGRFDKMDLKRIKAMMKLNLDIVVGLTHKVINLRKGQSPLYILNVSSTASFQPVPDFSIYAASKIFVLSFSRAIREELKPYKIFVSCVCPGPTKTEFFDKAKASHSIMNSDLIKMRPNAVAKAAVKGLFNKKGIIIPGFQNKLNYFGSKVFPVGFIMKLVKGVMK